MPTFIGLDLAWTSNNESGVCWLAGSTRENLRCTRLEAAICDTESLAEELAAVDGPVVVTIDAPLLYSPERDVEREIARRFGRYKAAPHQAHYAMRMGYDAGVRLGDALRARGFTPDPGGVLAGEQDGRVAVEVFPHTIHVRLFDLDERLPYKPRKGRSVAFRRAVMQEYQGYLRTLIAAECPRVLDHPDIEAALAPETAERAKGAALKRLDDTLDGLTCAVSAWMMWNRPTEWEMIGDLNGYIAVPRSLGEQPTLI